MQKGNLFIFLLFIFSSSFSQKFNLNWSSPVGNSNDSKMGNKLRVDDKYIYYIKYNIKTGAVISSGLAENKDYKPIILTYCKMDLNFQNEQCKDVTISEPEVELLKTISLSNNFQLFYKKREKKSNKVSYYVSNMDLDFNNSPLVNYFNIDDEDYKYSHTIFVSSPDKSKTITLVQKSLTETDEGYYSRMVMVPGKPYKKLEGKKKQFLIACNSANGTKLWERNIIINSKIDAYTQIGSEDIGIQNNGDVYIYLSQYHWDGMKDESFDLFKISNNGKDTSSSTYDFNDGIYVKPSNNALEISPIDNSINIVGKYYKITSNQGSKFRETADFEGILSFKFTKEGKLINKDIKKFPLTLIQKHKLNDQTIKNNKGDDRIMDYYDYMTFLFAPDTTAYFVLDYNSFIVNGGNTMESVLVNTISSNGKISFMNMIPQKQKASSLNEFLGSFSFIYDSKLHVLLNKNAAESTKSSWVDLKKSVCKAYSFDKSNNTSSSTLFTNDEYVFEPAQCELIDKKIILSKKLFDTKRALKLFENEYKLSFVK